MKRRIEKVAVIGSGIMGSGIAAGENRATEAARKAIDNQLLEDVGIDGARGLLINISATEESFTMAEVVREPGDPGMGWFPYVSDQALTVAPGRYTLVVWVDLGLGGMSRWVPVNSDGRGLYGCQTVFDVGDAAQTDVAVTANLVPDGWNTNCTTGIAIPGTDAAAAVAPPRDTDGM